MLAIASSAIMGEVGPWVFLLHVNSFRELICHTNEIHLFSVKKNDVDLTPRVLVADHCCGVIPGE